MFKVVRDCPEDQIWGKCYKLVLVRPKV